MSYQIDGKESSASQSQPIEFYEFKVYDQEYLYTSADIDIWYLGKKYLRAAIQRGDLDGSSDPDRGTLELTVPYLLPITQQIIVISPSFPIDLIIYSGQRQVYDYRDYGDERTDDSIHLSDVNQIWVGRVHSCTITGDEVSVHAISILNGQFRMGNTLRYQRACPYALYERYNCKVPESALATSPAPASITVNTAAKVQSPGLTWGVFAHSIGKDVALKSNWFVGGFVIYFDTFAKVEGRRSIIEYLPDSGDITVFPPLRGYLQGEWMTFLPGCKHNSTECQEKFDNIVNYGGDPILPVEDPYDPYVKVF